MGEHMAQTAKQWGITREAQDEIAAASHQNLAAAYERGFFDDLVTPFLGLTRDQNLRADSTVEKLAKLTPVFGLKTASEGATMTAGNSTPLTDGASAVLLGSDEWAAEHGLPVLAHLVDAQTAAVDYVTGHEGLLMAPAYALPHLLRAPGHEAAGLRPRRDPRGLRRDGAHHPGRLGERGVLPRPARASTPRSARSTAASSTSTAPRWRPVTPSPRPAGASSPRSRRCCTRRDLARVA